MNETSSAVADDGESERIEVNLNEDSEDKAVTRIRAVPKAKVGETSKDTDWMEKSKSVQKRISKLVTNFEQQRAEDQAEFQRQLAERDARLARLEGRDSNGKTDDASHEAAMAAMQTELEDAQERGDSKAVAQITRKMTSADAQFWAAKTNKQLAGEPAVRTVQDTQKARQAEAGNRWTRANSDWWNDTSSDEHIFARGAANNLHAQLVKEGSDPTTDEHFEIIRKKLAKRFPDIEFVSTLKKRVDADDQDDDEVESSASRRRPASMSLPNRGAIAGNGGARPNTATLSRADVANMRAVNLDPNNNKHVIQYLKEGQEMEANA